MAASNQRFASSKREGNENVSLSSGHKTRVEVEAGNHRCPRLPTTRLHDVRRHADGGRPRRGHMPVFQAVMLDSGVPAEVMHRLEQ